ncbi:hypothetical protein ACIOD2_47435 [Amycolatopsis sp. NPDC088138]|uniref:hypothetical protein n=1 Tax=Amycolatopsis sp. NPDC088138 TaxID=3363938 RepID=UPI003802C127
MRTFDDVLADIDREIAAADTIATDAPVPIAAYLRELLARHARTLTTSNGLPLDVVPANAIRSELEHLTRTSHPGHDTRSSIRCGVGCGHIDCANRPF